jgi:hypothetical protein
MIKPKPVKNPLTNYSVGELLTEIGKRGRLRALAILPAGQACPRVHYGPCAILELTDADLSGLTSFGVEAV